MLKNGLHGEAPVKWTAYLPPAWTLTEYRLHADPCSFPTPRPKPVYCSKADAQLVPEAGSCVDCPKRTGHNKLLFADMGTGQKDSCSDPKCYAAKLDAHIRQTIAAKPKLVQISTAFGQQKEGSTTLPRNKYVEVRQEKPKTKEEATRPEFKTCKYTTEAIVSEGIEKGELRKVCNGAAPSRACAVDSCRALWVELANGRGIEVAHGFDASTLERLVAVLEKR